MMNHGCVSQLIFDKDNDCIKLGDTVLHCGDCLSVLVFIGSLNKIEWVESSLEMNCYGEWYLTGLGGYDLIGLFARLI